jgi:hypothetical protein
MPLISTSNLGSARNYGLTLLPRAPILTSVINPTNSTSVSYTVNCYINGRNLSNKFMSYYISQLEKDFGANYIGIPKYNSFGNILTTLSQTANSSYSSTISVPNSVAGQAAGVPFYFSFSVWDGVNYGYANTTVIMPAENASQILIPGTVNTGSTVVTNINGVFVVPAGVYNITVVAIGAGGASLGTYGGGGGGGGLAYINNLPVTPGQRIPYQVGSSAVSSAGGDTWFISPQHLLAGGGATGTAGNNITGGGGGGAGGYSAAGGAGGACATVTWPGGAGGVSSGSLRTGGGAGGAGGAGSSSQTTISAGGNLGGGAAAGGAGGYTNPQGGGGVYPNGQTAVDSNGNATVGGPAQAAGAGPIVGANNGGSGGFSSSGTAGGNYGGGSASISASYAGGAGALRILWVGTNPTNITRSFPTTNVTNL